MKQTLLSAVVLLMCVTVFNTSAQTSTSINYSKNPEWIQMMDNPDRKSVV